MTLKQQNKHLQEELQKAKDKIVNIQEELKQEQLKRFNSATEKTKHNDSLKELNRLKNIQLLNTSSDLLEAENTITKLQSELRKEKGINKQDILDLKDMHKQIINVSYKEHSKIIDGLEDKLNQKDITLSILQSSLKEAATYTVDLEKDIKQKTQQKAISGHSLSAATIKLDKIIKTTAKLQDKIKIQKETIAELQIPLVISDKAIIKLEDALNEKIQTIADLQGRDNQYKNNTQALEDNAVSLQEQLDKEKDLHTIIRNRFKTADEHINKLRKELKKHQNTNLLNELQQAKDKIVNIQEQLKQEQLKRFELIDELSKQQNINANLLNETKVIPQDNRSKRKEGAKKWEQ